MKSKHELTWKNHTQVGITSSQVCVYLAELAPARIRGRVVGIQQWAIDWGILISTYRPCSVTVKSPPSANAALDSVSGLLRLLGICIWPCRFPHCLGRAGCSGSCARGRHVLLSRITTVACRSYDLPFPTALY